MQRVQTSRPGSNRWWRPLAVLALGGLLTAIALSPADAQTRSLTLFNTHTQERATVTFKRNGRFDPAGLAEMNRMLRDWRRNEQTRMAPELFDLIWEVYQEVGATEPIHIVSAYRSPATNNMLRSRSRGVAKVSQHMLGRAMDFFVPGVSLARLREVGLRKQIGGVGFYPTSGSPFVHMDVGSVRHWPRMTREQLARVFPDGKTVHLPTDGRPLARYDEALAEVERRKGRGSVARPDEADGDDDTPQGGNLITALFGGFGGGSGSGEAAPARTAERRPAELRQGPLPASSSDERPETAILPAPSRTLPAPALAAPVPDPAPARPTPTVLATAEPTPTAAGALLALPTPRPAPANRAPGSLVGSTPPLAEGWQVGAAPVTAEPAAPAAASATPADPRLLAALPPSRPAAEPVIAALPERPDMPIPRDRPVTAALAAAGQARPGTPASAPTALAALTGGPSVDEQFRALGYAPPTDLPSSGAAGSTLLAPGAPALQAALGALSGASAGATGSTGTRTGREARSAMPARGGDTLARLINRVSGVVPARLYDSAAVRARAFARFDHPDLDALPQLIAKPRDAIAFGFSSDIYGSLRTDRFTGASIAVLPVVRMP